MRAIALFLTLAGVPAFAQQPAPVPRRPVTVKHSGLSGNGHAQTHDGRVFVLTRSGGWQLRVFRPEALRADAEGVPVFDGAAFSDLVLLEANDTPGSGMTSHNAVALVPDPARVGENPFPSDANGGAQPDGAYATYALRLFATKSKTAAPYSRIGARGLRVVVSSPRTAQASVERAWFLGPLEELRTSGGQPVGGIEPTLTNDGHLMIMNGHPNNDGSISVLVYSYNQSPAATTGWSTPRAISDMHPVDRDTLVAGIPFADRFPIAQQPLKTAAGEAFAPGELYKGAYPWISRDGTELVHTALVAGVPGVNRARRGGLSVIGRWTGWTLRHIDGPLNPNREGLEPGSLRLFFSSPGASPSFWEPYRTAGRDLAGLPIPYTGGRPVFPLFGSNSRDYGEVSFEDHEDGDYVAFLRMNELITRGFEADPARTPDTSGQFNTGLLEGARFPQELDGTDANVGVSGQGIYCGEADGIRVQRSASLDQTRQRLSVELWAKRLVDLSDPGANRFRFLVHRPGAFNLILEESGRVQATVVSTGGQRRSGVVGAPLPLGEWAHVAFTYRSSDGRLRVYRDGALVSEQSFGPGEIAGSTQDLLVGPAAQRPAAPFVPAGQPIVLLDELKASRVERRAEEIAASAFHATPQPNFSGTLPGPLPLGLDPAQLKIPAGSFTAAQVELGRQLFFEQRLSADGSVSCATCHDPERAFTDGLARARGVSGVLLPRNTPTILNRAFSTRQFWDGRSGSLESQATKPIEHPDEMGLPLPQALAFLAGDPGYAQAFQGAFGGPPTKARLAKALAQFQRTQLAGGSKVDRFEAGERGALSAREQRGRLLFLGKARCTACHSGSNYTNESFHNTGFFTGPLTDPGRRKSTGRGRDLGRFKTPTLRDLTKTGPYMHDGSLPTLAEVIENYDQGGVNGTNLDPEIRPLGLSAAEKADLEAFLEALESPTPARAPRRATGRARPASN